MAALLLPDHVALLEPAQGLPHAALLRRQRQEPPRHRQDQPPRRHGPLRLPGRTARPQDLQQLRPGRGHQEGHRQSGRHPAICTYSHWQWVEDYDLWEQEPHSLLQAINTAVTLLEYLLNYVRRLEICLDRIM